ncbi:MAG TPA: nuclear transport factor 2 family protein [Pyrinomonadaceae bacterium]|nr:nuclear transport factor 2 family protein [Pyrinomonadaceae bacterium]
MRIIPSVNSAFLVVLVASVSIYGQSSKPSKSTDSVLATIHELCKAFETRDTDRLRQNMTEDFTLTSSTGVITSLADEIGDLKSGRAKYTVFKNVDMKPRLYGDTAVVTGKTIVKGVYDKEAFEAEFQFTDTLIWKGGRWWMVSSHASRLKP